MLTLAESESPEKSTSDACPGAVLVEQTWSISGAEVLVLVPQEITTAYLVGWGAGCTGGMLVTIGR